jgi:hypothetical protein
MRNFCVVVLVSAILLTGFVHRVAAGLCTIMDVMTLNPAVAPPSYIRWGAGSSISYSFAGSYPPPSSLFNSALESAKSKWDQESPNFSFASGAENVLWIASGWVGYPNYLAVTSQPISGWITSTDTQINGQYYSWTTNEASTDTLDFETLMVHEIGHVLGLKQGGSCSETVMIEGQGKSDRRRDTMSLDQEAIDYLYCDPSGQMAAISSGAQVTATTCDNNSAVEIIGFNVVEGVAEWTSLYEYGTAEYVLEGCNEPNGPGTPLVTEPPRIGEHRVVLPKSGFSLFRLVEMVASGRRHTVGVTPSVPRRSGAMGRGTSVPARSSVVPRDRNLLRERTDEGANEPLAGPECVMFALWHEFWLSVLFDVRGYWQEKGYQVVIVLADDAPPETRQQWIDDKIKYYANTYDT